MLGFSLRFSAFFARVFAFSAVLAVCCGATVAVSQDAAAQDAAAPPLRIEVPREPPTEESRSRARAHADCYEWASARLLNSAQADADRDLSSVIGGDYAALDSSLPSFVPKTIGEHSEFQAWRHERRLSHLMSECVARFDAEAAEVRR